MINLLLPTAVFFPIVMGFVPVFVKDTKKVNLAMVIMSVAELVLCGALALTAKNYSGVVAGIEWFAGLGVHFDLNGLGILQAVATAIIWVGSSVFSDE